MKPPRWVLVRQCVVIRFPLLPVVGTRPVCLPREEGGKGKRTRSERLGISPMKVSDVDKGGGNKGSGNRLSAVTSNVVKPTVNPKTVAVATCSAPRTTATILINKATQTVNTPTHHQTMNTPTYHLRHIATQTCSLPSSLNPATDKVMSPVASPSNMLAASSIEKFSSLTKNKLLAHVQKQRACREKIYKDWRLFELTEEQKIACKESLFGPGGRFRKRTKCKKELKEPLKEQTGEPPVTLRDMVTEDYTIPCEIASLIKRYWLKMRFQK